MSIFRMKGVLFPTTIFIVSFFYISTQATTCIKKPIQIGEKSFSFYQEYFSDENSTSIESYLRAKQWVVKAKREKEYEQLVMAYKTLMYMDKPANQIYYTDSIIFSAYRTNDKKIIGSAYLTKGIMHYNQKELVRALENYVRADKYIAQTSDKYLMHKLKYVIAQSKFYLGYYHESISLLKECKKFFEIENDQAYLSTIHLLALCHINVKQYSVAQDLINLGLEEAIELELKNMSIHFQLAQAIHNFNVKKYEAASNQLRITAARFELQKDTLNQILAELYLTKCMWIQKDKSNALPYLFNIDKTVSQLKYNKPELREAYEMLYEYYNETNNQKLEMLYFKKLKVFDDEIAEKYKYLSRTMHKKYDTAQIIKTEQEKLSKSQQEKLIGYLIACCAIIATIGLLITNHRNKKQYLYKFNQLMMSDSSAETKTTIRTTDVDLSDLNPDLIETILTYLETFEREKIYLEENMNLTRLAKELQTNMKYTSRIILKYRGKKTVDYTNDLKTNHIIELLKTQPKYRRYTAAALGDEAGFGSAQNFTRAFKSMTDLTPMYFIKQLNQTQRGNL